MRSGEWRRALVVEEEAEKVKLSFEGAGDEDDEWVPTDAVGLAPLNTQCALDEVGADQWREALAVGDWVDVQDRGGRWHKAVVIDANEADNIRICIDGFGKGEGGEAWLPRNSDRVAKAQQFTGSGIMPLMEDAAINDEMDSSHTYAELRGLQWSSQFLVDNLNLFGEMDGFETILTWLVPEGKKPSGDDGEDEEEEEEVVTMQCIQYTAKAVARVAECMSRPFAAKYIPRLVDAVTKSMLGLVNEELRETTKADIEDIVCSLTMLLRRIKSTEEEVAQVVEMFVLDFALKCFKSIFLQKRMLALETLKLVMDMCEARKRYPEGIKMETKLISNIKLVSRQPVVVSRHIDAPRLIAWLQEHKLLEDIFNRPHQAMVDRSVYILKFLAANDAITIEIIETMWAGQERTDEETASSVHAALRSVLIQFDASQLQHFNSLLTATPAAAFKLEMVELFGIVAHSLDPTAQETSLSALERLLSLTRDDADVTEEIAAACRTKLESLLTKKNHPVLKTRRKLFMDRCMTNLKDHNSVPQALDLLRCIVETYPDKAAIKEGELSCWQVIQQLNEEEDLLAAFFQDFTQFKREAYQILNGKEDTDDARIPGNRHRGFLASVRARLDFLSFVMANSNLQLSTTNVDNLWEACAQQSCSDSEEELFFTWLSTAACGSADTDTSDQFVIMDFAVSEYLFTTWMSTMKPEELSIPAYKCLEQYFLFLNTRNGKIEIIKEGNSFVVLDADLDGLAIHWNAALQATNEEVLSAASSFLSKLPGHLAPTVEVAPFYEEHISHCFAKLGAGSTGTARHQALGLLKGLIREAEKGLLAKLPYRPHGAMSRGQPLTVVLNRSQVPVPGPSGEPTKERVAGELAKIPLSVHTNMTVRDLFNVAGAAVGYTAEQLRLLCAGKELKDGSQTLEALNVIDGQVVGMFFQQRRMLDNETQVLRTDIVLPSLVLCRNEENFATLFELLSLPEAADQAEEVWMLLMRLPTEERLLSNLETLRAVKCPVPDWNEVLDSKNVYKLLYQLQIMEALVQPAAQDQSTDADSISSDAGSLEDAQLKDRATWRKKFLLYGGFEHLNSILLAFQEGDGEEDGDLARLRKMCTGLLLKMFSLFLGTALATADPTVSPPRAAISRTKTPPCSPHMKGMSGSPGRAMSGSPGRNSPGRIPASPRGAHVQEPDPPSPTDDARILTRQLSDPGLSKKVVDVVNFDVLVKKLSDLVATSASGTSVEDIYMVELILELLATVLAARFDGSLAALEDGKALLLTCLDAQEPSIRTRGLQFFVSMAKPESAAAAANRSFLIDALKPTLENLDNVNSVMDRCGERFSLLVALITFTAEDGKEEAFSVEFLEQVVLQLPNRPVEEGFHERHTDGVMAGACRVLETAMAKNTKCKETVGKLLVPILLNHLFSIPTFDEKGEGDEGMAYWQNRTVTDDAPQCKTPETRQAAFDTISEAIKDCQVNLSLALPLLCDRTAKLRPQDKWRYSTEDAGRSDTGQVGLVNPKNICYLNSLMQQLRFIPQLRRGVLGTENPNPGESSFLSQLQTMFGSLLMSKRKAYDPTGFCMAMKFDGGPIDVRVQQDMTEFFAALDDNLDVALKGTDNANLMGRCVKGCYANQVISNDISPPYKSEVEDIFQLHLLDVKNHTGLLESLEAVVEGEMVSDFKVERGDEKHTVNAKRRSLIKTPPDTLIIALKRFDMDYETFQSVKINDYFEFPQELDLAPYTKEGVELLESGEEGEMPDYSYDLHGVLIHSGTVDTGHYYSYIRERGGDDWYEFDDACVSEIDIDDLPELAFGGEVVKESYDHKSGKVVTRRSVRANNAYLLVYERVKEGRPDDAERSSEEEAAGSQKSSTACGSSLVGESMPGEIRRHIFEDNVSFLEDCLTYGEEYSDFLMKLALELPMVNCNDYTAELEPEAPGQLGLTLLTKHCLEFLAHAKEWDPIEPLCERLKELYMGNVPASKRLLASLSVESLTPVLLLCPEPRVRHVIADLLLHVITAVAPHERGMYREPYDENGDHPTLVGRLFMTLLTMMDDVRKYWVNMPQYFTLLGACANISSLEWEWFMSNSIIFRLGDFMLGNESPMQRQRKHAQIKMGGWATPNFVPLLSCMHLYVIGAVNRTIPFSKFDQMILMNDKFWKLALNHGNNAKAVAEMMAARSFEDADFSSFACGNVIEGVSVSDYDQITPFLECIGALITIRDGLQQGRIQHIMNSERGFLHYTFAYKARYELCTYKSLKWLCQFVRGDDTLDEWLSENCESWEWMGEWLQQYHEERQDEASVSHGKDRKVALQRVLSSKETVESFNDVACDLLDRPESPFLQRVASHFSDADLGDGGEEV